MADTASDYMTASEAEKERIREQKAITYAMVTGLVPCVCVFCCNTFVSERNLYRHVRTSKRCNEARQRQ